MDARAEAWTVERYLRETAPGEYFIILEGEKIMSPSGAWKHQVVVFNLALKLRAWADQTGQGKVAVAPLDVVLGPKTVVQPDVLWVSAAHLDRITPQNIQGAPDLVIEVLSPGSLRLDRGRKRHVYARYGIPEYWIVSPEEQSVEVLRLHGETYETLEVYDAEDEMESPALPGFRCAIRDLFVE